MWVCKKMAELYSGSLEAVYVHRVNKGGCIGVGCGFEMRKDGEGCIFFFFGRGGPLTQTIK